jgi:hypothetical protein
MHGIQYNIYCVCVCVCVCVRACVIVYIMRIWVVCIRFIRSHNNHNNRLSRAKVYTHSVDPVSAHTVHRIKSTEKNTPKTVSF